MDGDDDVVRDASFQQDPEHFDFNCLSSEETWNYLDSQAREATKEIKVRKSVNVHVGRRGGFDFPLELKCTGVFEWCMNSPS